MRISCFAHNLDLAIHIEQESKRSIGAILAAIPRENPARKNLSLGEQFSKEISMYLEQSCEESTSDPLLWWKTHETAFPHLAKLARKYLCVPATSVLSERVFSKGGNIVDPLRSRLAPEHVNTLVFL